MGRPEKSGSGPRRAAFLQRMGKMPGPQKTLDGKATPLLSSLRAWGASSKADAVSKGKAISKRNAARKA